MVDDPASGVGSERLNPPLPLFAVEGWQGSRHVIRQTRQRPGSAGVSHSGLNGRTIDVVSHLPDDDRFEKLRAWAPINTLLQAAGRAPGVSDAQRHAYRQAADDMRRGQRSDIASWEMVTVPVGGEEIDFEVFRLAADFWCGLGRRAGVLLTVHSHGVPLAELSLVSVQD